MKEDLNILHSRLLVSAQRGLKRFCRLLISAIILVTTSVTGQGQAVYPTQVQVFLQPPYSLYLDDYITGMRERISVSIVSH
ncbi:MAG: hypothetical protein LBD59_00400, partial [Prevotellaceae bacterium]|nr:hypothetical protein [Prevotellaceae bacterium]